MQTFLLVAPRSHALTHQSGRREKSQITAMFRKLTLFKIIRSGTKKGNLTSLNRKIQPMKETQRYLKKKVNTKNLGKVLSRARVVYGTELIFFKSERAKATSPSRIVFLCFQCRSQQVEIERISGVTVDGLLLANLHKGVDRVESHRGMHCVQDRRQGS